MGLDRRHDAGARGAGRSARRKAKTATQEEMLAGFADDGSGWPERPFLVCAIDCDTGELRAFTNDDGVPINVAVAASCAVPGLFPPIEINGRRYTDGGVRSWTSADAVLPFAPDRALIVSPGGIKDGPGTRGLASRQLDAESRLLSDRGIDVRSIELDEATRAVGQNLMDPESARLSGETGYEQGKRLACRDRRLVVGMTEIPLRVQADDPEYQRQLAEEAAFWEKPHVFCCALVEEIGEGPFDRYRNRRFTGDERTPWFETIARHGSLPPRSAARRQRHQARAPHSRIEPDATSHDDGCQRRLAAATC